MTLVLRPDIGALRDDLETFLARIRDEAVDERCGYSGALHRRRRQGVDSDEERRRFPFEDEFSLAIDILNRTHVAVLFFADFHDSPQNAQHEQPRMPQNAL